MGGILAKGVGMSVGRSVGKSVGVSAVGKSERKSAGLG